MPKLTDDDRRQRSISMAEQVCLAEDARTRKKDLSAALNKEIRYHEEMALKLAQEINSGEASEEQRELTFE